MHRALAVSVVIPFFTGSSILARTLASVARQDYPRDAIEVVIAHDGSTEDIRELALDILGDIALREVWISRRGYRLASARNAAIRCASHETIILIDFDIVVPDALVAAHVARQLEGRPALGFGLRRFVDLSDVDYRAVKAGEVRLDALPAVASISNRLGTTDKRSAELALLPHHPFPCNLCHGCNLAFSRGMAIGVGLFDEAFNGNSNYEDIEFAHRMWLAGAEIVYVPDATVYHQENEVVDYDVRRQGMSANLPKLYDRITGLQEFRERAGGARR